MWGVLLASVPIAFAWVLCEALQAIVLRRPAPRRWIGRATEWVVAFLLPIVIVASVALLLADRAEQAGAGGLALVLLGMACGALMTRWRLLRRATVRTVPPAVPADRRAP